MKFDTLAPVKEIAVSTELLRNIQEALWGQGYNVKTTGVFDQQTRDGIKVFQSNHRHDIQRPADGKLDEVTLAVLQKCCMGSGPEKK